jgi:glycosyltransferase involved in cell wall biosynthesis
MRSRWGRPLLQTQRTGQTKDLGIDFYGEFDLATGLGVSSRGFALALEAAGIPTHIIPLGFMFSGVATTDFSFASDPRRFQISLEHVNADTTLRFERTFRREISSVRYRIAMWYWELAALRPEWFGLSSHYDEIWVASNFGRRAVMAATSVPVHVMPPPVTAEHADGIRARLAFGVPREAFVFLYVFDFSSYLDRKNPGCLVRAFAKEFGGDRGFRLVLKVSNADRSAPDFQSFVAHCSDFPNIQILADVLPQAELDGVFAMADCYVSPHRSEGFGFTVAEELLRGCPVIATNYGASTDFVTSATGYPLDYQLVELEEHQGPYLSGYVWADPSEAHLRELMRYVVEHPDESRARALEGQRFVSEHYSIGARAASLRERITAAFASMRPIGS